MSNFSTLKQFEDKNITDYLRRYRVGEDVLVVFEAKDQIYIRNLTTDYWRVYHRWAQIRGTYKIWKRFRDALRRRRKLTDQDIYNLAFKYEIDCSSCHAPPIIDDTYMNMED